MEASVKAAKFNSCVVGHLIDCKLTVIERDFTLLLRRDMALDCPAGSPALPVYGHQGNENQNFFLYSASPNNPSLFLCFWLISLLPLCPDFQFQEADHI